MDSKQTAETPSQIAIEVTTAINILSQVAKSQGFAIMLLCLYAWRSETKQERQDAEIRSCHETYIDYLQSSQKKTVEALDNLTKAIDRLDDTNSKRQIKR